jgi:hypothetical protein
MNARTELRYGRLPLYLGTGQQLPLSRSKVICLDRVSRSIHVHIMQGILRGCHADIRAGYRAFGGVHVYIGVSLV